MADVKAVTTSTATPTLMLPKGKIKSLGLTGPPDDL